jgi:hypothetical protein
LGVQALKEQFKRRVSMSSHSYQLLELVQRMAAVICTLEVDVLPNDLRNLSW